MNYTLKQLQDRVSRMIKEQVIARDYQEAKQVALARNPNAKVVSVTAIMN